MVFDLRVMYQVAIGGRWGSTVLVFDCALGLHSMSNRAPLHMLPRLKRQRHRSRLVPVVALTGF